MKEMIKKILDAIPDHEIRSYFLEKDKSKHHEGKSKSEINKERRLMEKQRIADITREMAK